jgi:hypothetical protein
LGQGKKVMPFPVNLIPHELQIFSFCMFIASCEVSEIRLLI